MALFSLHWSCGKLRGAGVESSGSRAGGYIGSACLWLVSSVAMATVCNATHIVS